MMSDQAFVLIGKRSVSQAKRMLARVVEKSHSIGELLYGSTPSGRTAVEQDLEEGNDARAEHRYLPGPES